MAVQIEQATHIDPRILKQIWGDQWTELAEDPRLTQVVLAYRGRGSDRYDLLTSRWATKGSKWSSVTEVHQVAVAMFSGIVSPRSQREQVDLSAGLHLLEGSVPQEPERIIDWGLTRARTTMETNWTFRAAINPNGLETNPELQLLLLKGGR